MSVYNPQNYGILCKAVNSILMQSEQRLEFIICDDGSEKGTGEILRKLAEKDPRIRLIFLRQNKGIAAGLNACIAESCGRYIARMDADDISAPDRLEKQMKFLDSHSQYAFVGCSAKILEGGKITGNRRMPLCPEKEDFLKYSPYIHPSVMFRKEALEIAGGYRETPEVRRCEDYDLFMRLHVLQCYGYNLQEELFFYREDASSFRKRTLRCRMDEYRLRKKGFRKLGLTGCQTQLQVYRPVLGGILPAGFTALMKRKGITG